MGVTVDELLKHPFVNRTRLVREKIIQEGKPRPALKSLVSEVQSTNINSEDGNADKFVIIFDVVSYDHVEWLTGCDIRQSLFCWPCMLFKTQKDVWNTTGITDLNDLRGVINTHEKSITHIQALLDLQVFASKISFSIAGQAPQRDTEALKKNRDILELIIDSVCHLIENCYLNRNTIEVEDCVKTLRHIQIYDILRSSLIEETIEKIQKDPQILTDVIEAIASTVKLSIFKDVGNSSYVSVILSEHSTDPTKSQLSTILRYLKSGKVCERFVGFKNNVANSHQIIIDQIFEIINSFQIEQKVVAISFDGSSSYLKEAFVPLNRDLRSRHRHAYFIPCHFHNLESVLQESVCCIKECDFFFKNVTILKSYFQENSDFWEQFQAAMAGIAPNLGSFLSSFQAEFLNAVKNYRIEIINFFDLVTRTGDLKKSDLVKITGLRSFLVDFRSIFLTGVFIKMFNKVVPLTQAFHSNSPGLAFDGNVIDGVLESFSEELLENSYETLWNEAYLFYNNFQTINQDAAVITTTEKLFVWHKIYLDIVICMKYQIKYRFESARKLSFYYIFDLANAGKGLDLDHVLRLNEMYSQNFKYAALDKDLKLVLANKPVESLHELYKFFTRCALKNTLFNVCELLLTLPCTPPTVEGGGFSKLQIVKSRSCTSNECDINLLCVEQEYLEEMRTVVSFNTQVMNQFQQINKNFELY